MNQHEVNEPPTRTTYPGVYFGRVEQRIDPLRLGRLRVRISGIHSDEIQTEDLPWCLPCFSAWQKGGFFGIPPLDEMVIVQFVRGHAENPVWSGGHWGLMTKKDEEGENVKDQNEQLVGKTEVADGKLFSKHEDWPTSMFGGKENTALLKPERFPSVDPDDAPNNFGFASPHNKHWELDDRKGREKVKLSDQLDNYYWVNSEHAAMSQEAHKGHQKGEEPAGMTFNSDPEVITWQAYGHGSPLGPGYWSVTNDRWKGFLELATPGMWKVLIDRRRKRVEVWTGNGHHIVAADGMTPEDITKLAEDEETLSEEVMKREDAKEPTLLKGLRNTSMPLRSSNANAMSSFIGLFTADGREFVLGDKLYKSEESFNKLTYCLSPDGSYWAMMEDVEGVDTPMVEIYSAGKMRFVAADEMSFHCDQRITLDGQTIHLNDGFLDNTQYLMEANPPVKQSPWFGQPPNADRVIRAPDYPYYADPEKIPGYND